jgi:hypothetical protein
VTISPVQLLQALIGLMIVIALGVWVRVLKERSESTSRRIDDADREIRELKLRMGTLVGELKHELPRLAAIQRIEQGPTFDEACAMFKKARDRGEVLSFQTWLLKRMGEVPKEEETERRFRV